MSYVMVKAQMCGYSLGEIQVCYVSVVKPWFHLLPGGHVPNKPHLQNTQTHR